MESLDTTFPECALLQDWCSPFHAVLPEASQTAFHFVVCQTREKERLEYFQVRRFSMIRSWHFLAAFGQHSDKPHLLPLNCTVAQWKAVRPWCHGLQCLRLLWAYLGMVPCHSGSTARTWARRRRELQVWSMHPTALCILYIYIIYIYIYIISPLFSWGVSNRGVQNMYKKKNWPLRIFSRWGRLYVC